MFGFGRNFDEIASPQLERDERGYHQLHFPQLAYSVTHLIRSGGVTELLTKYVAQIQRLPSGLWQYRWGKQSVEAEESRIEWELRYQSGDHEILQQAENIGLTPSALSDWDEYRLESTLNALYGWQDFLEDSSEIEALWGEYQATPKARSSRVLEEQMLEVGYARQFPNGVLAFAKPFEGHIQTPSSGDKFWNHLVEKGWWQEPPSRVWLRRTFAKDGGQSLLVEFGPMSLTSSWRWSIGGREFECQSRSKLRRQEGGWESRLDFASASSLAKLIDWLDSSGVDTRSRAVREQVARCTWAPVDAQFGDGVSRMLDARYAAYEALGEPPIPASKHDYPFFYSQFPQYIEFVGSKDSSVDVPPTESARMCAIATSFEINIA